MALTRNDVTGLLERAWGDVTKHTSARLKDTREVRKAVNSLPAAPGVVALDLFEHDAVADVGGATVTKAKVQPFWTFTVATDVTKEVLRQYVDGKRDPLEQLLDALVQAAVDAEDTALIAGVHGQPGITTGSHPIKVAKGTALPAAVHQATTWLSAHGDHRPFNLILASERASRLTDQEQKDVVTELGGVVLASKVATDALVVPAPLTAFELHVAADHDLSVDAIGDDSATLHVSSTFSTRRMAPITAARLQWDE